MEWENTQSTCTRPVGLVTSTNLLKLSNAFERAKGRAIATIGLIKAYDLLDQLTILPPLLASTSDLTQFHDKRYVDVLANFTLTLTRPSADLDQGILDNFGLDFACPPKPGLYEYVQHVAGATLSGCDWLLQKMNVPENTKPPVAINWAGGWHHAKSDQADGFCYVNDCILACMKFVRAGYRVLYLDLDVHHGDAVQDAFMITDKVATVSVHLNAPGFYPCTGAWDDTSGSGKGYGYNLNIPVKEGLTDSQFMKLARSIFPYLNTTYNPDIVVVQFGTDALAKDPLGGLNLTNDSYLTALDSILSWNKPVLMLGGGGYHATNTARLWTQLTARVLGAPLCEDIPEHNNMLVFGPNFTLNVEKSNTRNENTDGYIECLIQDVKDFLLDE